MAIDAQKKRLKAGEILNLNAVERIEPHPMEAAFIKKLEGSYLVDYYHTCEYLAKAAKDCVKNGDNKVQKAWGDAQKKRLKAGEIEAIMAELEPWRNGKKGKESNPSEDCHRYLRNRSGQFDYMGAKAANLPIGSGEIESANSAVVQERLKIPGAWWKTDNASYMLSLREMRANDEWDEYWKNAI